MSGQFTMITSVGGEGLLKLSGLMYVMSCPETQARKVNFDKASGLLEILLDQLAKEDEGSYTAQLRDGRAKNQFTLVFVDESEFTL